MKKSILLTLAVAAFAACAAPQKKVAAKDDKAAKGEAADASEAAPLAPGADVTEASLRGSGFDADPEIKPVHFDYDSAQLSAATLETLKANSAVMKKRDGYEFLVAGHSDERGTVAYNLALAQKRAKEVRDYYLRLGVDGRRVATISYGKEQPGCVESTEECWSQNRRAVTGVREKATVAK
jgi:peptidoglycan-associated lipoprotein